MGRNSLASIVLVLLIAAGGLFYIQNSARTTQLSFDIGLAAWQLEREVSIPALVGICFLAGLVLGWLVAFVRIVRLGRQVRELEQRLTLSQFSNTTAKSKETGGW